MKILFISQSAHLYGSERGLLTLLEQPQSSRLEPVVICPDNGPLPQVLEKLGIVWEKMEFGGYGWLRRPDWQLKFLFQFMRLIQRHKPHAVVINFEGNVPLMVLGCRLMGCPVIRFLKREVRPAHSSAPGYAMHLFDRLSFLACNGVICISGAVEQQLRHALKVSSEFPAVSLFDPQELVAIADEEIQRKRKSLGIEADAPVIGQFARLHPVKGIDTLVKAAPFVLEKLPSARFLVVGDIDGSAPSLAYRQKLIELTQQVGVADSFIWTGFVCDPLTVMAACDVTALPTRAEGLGRVLIESWAVGRPVIASKTDGPEEVIGLSGGGLLHPIDDHLTLANQLIQLLSQPSQRAFLGDNGRQWVGQNCTPSEYQSRFLTYVERFIKLNKYQIT